MQIRSPSRTNPYFLAQIAPEPTPTPKGVQPPPPPGEGRLIPKFSAGQTTQTIGATPGQTPGGLPPWMTDPTQYPPVPPPAEHQWEWKESNIPGIGAWVPVRIKVTKAMTEYEKEQLALDKSDQIHRALQRERQERLDEAKAKADAADLARQDAKDEQSKLQADRSYQLALDQFNQTKANNLRDQSNDDRAWAFQLQKYQDDIKRWATTDARVAAQATLDYQLRLADFNYKVQSQERERMPWLRTIAGIQAGKLHPEYSLPQAFKEWMETKAPEMAETPFWRIPGGKTAQINKARLEGTAVPGTEAPFIDVPRYLLENIPSNEIKALLSASDARTFRGSPGSPVWDVGIGRGLQPTLTPLSEPISQMLSATAPTPTEGQMRGMLATPGNINPWEQAKLGEYSRALGQQAAIASGGGPTYRAAAWLREQKEASDESLWPGLQPEYQRRMQAAQAEEKAAEEVQRKTFYESELKRQKEEEALLASARVKTGIQPPGYREAVVQAGRRRPFWQR